MFCFNTLNSCQNTHFKISLDDRAVLHSVRYPEDIYGGEVIFVPKIDGSGEEDDGYLLTLLHSEKLKQSYFHIYNATTTDLVAAMEIDARVPYGFHANWFPQGQIFS